MLDVIFTLILWFFALFVRVYVRKMATTGPLKGIVGAAAQRLATAQASAASSLAGKIPPTTALKPLGTKKRPLRVCVISSSYAGTDSATSQYDAFECGPQHWITSGTYAFDVKELTKADSFRQVRELVTSDKYDVFFNLCDGGRDEKRAGVDVLTALEEHNAAFTGTDHRSFEPNKIDMKVLVGNAGVKTPNFILVTDTKSLGKKCRHLKFPVIVKHVSGYASVGIQKDNRCENLEQLEKKLGPFIKEFNHALIEEFIRGREGTVLACRDPDSPHGVKVFPPVMFSFLKSPDDFAHFDNKWTGSWESMTLEPMAETDPSYRDVIDMARNSFSHVLNGVGYGRCDFRIDAAGNAYFLEINPNCGMWYPPATGGDFSDKMVQLDPQWNHATFVEKACRFALEQQRIRTPWYVISHDSNGHFTTRASKSVEEGRPLFGDHVHSVPVVAKALFKLGKEDQDVGCVLKRADGIQQVVAIRHSCEPNMTLIHGQTLTCAAKRQINAGEELTIDYSSLRDMSMPKFSCRCGTANCREVVIPHPPMPRMVDAKLLKKLLLERKRAAREEKRRERASVKPAAALEPATPVASEAVAQQLPPPPATANASLEAASVKVTSAPEEVASAALDRIPKLSARRRRRGKLVKSPPLNTPS